MEMPRKGDSHGLQPVLQVLVSMSRYRSSNPAWKVLLVGFYLTGFLTCALIDMPSKTIEMEQEMVICIDKRTRNVKLPASNYRNNK